LLQSQAVTSSGQVEQNVDHYESATCGFAKTNELKTSLFGSWHFDEKSGTEAVDFSGNGYDADVAGATWTYGKLGSGLEFDGENDFVRMDFPIVSLQEMTGCAWIKVNAVEDFGSPVKDGIIVGDGHHFQMWVLTDGKFEFGAWMHHPSGPHINRLFESVDSFAFGLWTHLCVVNKADPDGSGPSVGTSKLYVNGNLRGEGSFANEEFFGDLSFIEIGRTPNLGPNYFDGVIDEVRFYNKALSRGEVLTDANCGILL
ncbi:MAG: LamG domain-containing protein, partial [Candidatus Micrarchaeia archaeon]